MFNQNSQARSHLVIQLIGLGYVAYLMYSLIKGYLNGEAGLSLPLFCLLIAGMAVIEVVLGVFAYRGWKRDRAREQEEEKTG